MLTLTLTEDDMFIALRSFLMGILPGGVEVIQGQINRVAEPEAENFVVMTALMRQRLATNRHSYDDAQIVGSIAETVLTVTAVGFGELRVGSPIYSTTDGAILPRTDVVEFLTGDGGVGTYRVSRSQTVASGTLYAGTTRVKQDTQATVQLDVHGPESADNVQRITTLFRDEYACDALAASGFDIQPLYTSEPRQAPFLNGESQIEFRWTVDAVLEIRPVVQYPQQFAGTVSVDLLPCDLGAPNG